MRENLDDFGLSRRIIFERPAADFPRLLDRSRTVEEGNESVGGITEAMKLIARGVTNDVPAFAAIELAGNLRLAAVSPAGSPRDTRTRRMSVAVGESLGQLPDCQLSVARKNGCLLSGN